MRYHAGKNGFTERVVRGGDFYLLTYQKVTNPSAPYVVYIEEDGAIGDIRVSDDPTPRKSRALRLAMLDKRPNVVYVSRPCQYVKYLGQEFSAGCDQRYWSDMIMSDPVIESVNSVINQVTKQAPVHLVGGSGGGSVAVLVAARNSHVKSILTIGANLDHAAFRALHRVSRMGHSLDPINYVDVVARIPQLHVSCGKDIIVPPFIVDKFVSSSAGKCAQHVIIPNIDHYKGWEDAWPSVLDIPIVCRL